jgi:hypothetical protein
MEAAMRLLIIGTDDDGRSAIDRIEALDEGAEGASRGLLSAEVWASASERGALADRPRSAPLRPLDCRPGEVSWRFVHHAPGASIDLHRTDSIDCDTVLGGHVELGLEAGSVLLEPGDLVLIPGLAHRWLAGDEGSTLSVVLVGLEP